MPGQFGPISLVFDYTETRSCRLGSFDRTLAALRLSRGAYPARQASTDLRHHRLLDPDHVLLRDTFSDANNQLDLLGDSLSNTQNTKYDSKIYSVTDKRASRIASAAPGGGT